MAEGRREAWQGFSLRDFRRNKPCPHLDFELTVSGTVREFKFGFSHQD
jgi:hypothetical protein